MLQNYINEEVLLKDDWQDCQRKFQVLYDRTYLTFERELPNSGIARNFILQIGKAGIDPDFIVDKLVAYSCGGDCFGEIRSGFEDENRAIKRTLKRLRAEIHSLRSISPTLMGKAELASAFADEIETLKNALERSWERHGADIHKRFKSARTYFRMEIFLAATTEYLRIRVGRPCYKEVTALLACTDPHNKRWNETTGLDLRRACTRYLSSEFSKTLLSSVLDNFSKSIPVSEKSHRLVELASRGR